MSFQWQYSEAFWLLALVPLFILLYFLYLGWKKRTAKDIGDERLVLALTRTHSSKKEALKFSLVVLAFTLGIISLANPRKPDMSSAEQRAGIDIIIALDVSNSMLATDVPPVRLQKAQRFLSEMINKMPNDRFGLILFAGHAYLQMPLSTDHEAARMFVSTASPNAVTEQGTSIADVFKKAEEAFGESSRFKTIVLVTDGETHDEDAVSAAKELAGKGVMINTVGIGSPGGSSIIDPATQLTKKDESGNTVISKLNEELLKELASATNGTYVHLQAPGAAVDRLLAQYQNVERKALPDMASMSFVTYYWWLVFPMFLMLLAEIFIPDRKKLRE